MKMQRPSAAPAGAEIAMLQAEAAFEHLGHNFSQTFWLRDWSRVWGFGVVDGLGARIGYLRHMGARRRVLEVRITDCQRRLRDAFPLTFVIFGLLHSGVWHLL